MLASIILLIVLVSFVLFAGVIAVGAPYLPTLNKRIDDAVELLNLKPGQTMLELGCGDGRMLIAVAKNGIRAVGYELNPILVGYAKVRTWKYRALITVKWGNYWSLKWPQADAIYVFLLQPYMSKLHKKVIQYSKQRSLIVVSFAFKITEKNPVKEKNGMFLYKYNKSHIK